VSATDPNMADEGSPTETEHLNVWTEGEEGTKDPEPDIDLEDDPFEMNVSQQLGPEWEKMIKALKIVEPRPPSPEEHRNRIRWILGILDNEKGATI
jgi:hypothetical protein